jgi:hypothetical protein
MIRAILAAGAMAIASPTLAQSTTTSPENSVTAPSPAKLVVATRIASRLLPDGIYRKMMGGTLTKMMDGMTDQITSLPLSSLAEMGGLAPEKVKSLGSGTMKEMMAILDPAFDQRMKITMSMMMGDMVDLMSSMEPSVREGMAEAYARRFTDTQLADLEQFFATPTGSQYAAQSMEIFADPALVSRMQAMVPKMMQAMPAMMKKVGDATASLPKPKTTSELTASDKAKLAKLMGIDPKDMK